MVWKAPQRPAVKISQCYNDGIANVFTVSDAAAPGYLPIEELTPKISLRYEERRVGIRRYYDAKQNQIRVERVIRVPHAGGVSSQDAVIDRLYELGVQLGSQFMQISKSTLINLSYMDSIEPGFSGTLLLKLRNGSSDYVSRTYLPSFKKYLGL